MAGTHQQVALCENEESITGLEKIAETARVQQMLAGKRTIYSGESSTDGGAPD